MKRAMQVILPIVIIGLLFGLYYFKNQSKPPTAHTAPTTESVVSDPAQTPDQPVAAETEQPAQEGILEMIDEYDLAAWKAENKPLLIEFSTDS